jgi:hypothetical protein
MRRGGRWNAPGTFPVVYLNLDRATARANAKFLLTKKLSGSFLTVDDLDPSELPVLVTTAVPEDDYVDVVTDDGCSDAGLPVTYPKDSSGAPVGHGPCQAVGLDAWTDGERGIACRSAAEDASINGEELAYFERSGARLTPIPLTEVFADWYGPIDF